MEQLQGILLRLLEWMVGLAAGLVAGWFVVWLPPGVTWPAVTGVAALVIGGKMIFEGVFPGFGYGLAISTAISLGYFVTFFFGVGLD